MLHVKALDDVESLFHVAHHRAEVDEPWRTRQAQAAALAANRFDIAA
jgi:hypothetical protein